MNYTITIGRQYGSGGRFIGDTLAKKLGISFYDNELINKVSEESGFCIDYIKENDEKKDSVFAFLGGNESTSIYTAASNVSLAQFNTIKKIADEESCVIIGRCSDYILKDHKNVVNVFIMAPIEERVARAVKYYNLDEKKAREKIAKMDKKRGSYYFYYTDQKWGDASHYDLCISSSVGIEECAEIIANFVKAKLKI